MRGHAFCWFSLLTVLLMAGDPPARGYGNERDKVQFDLYRDYLIVVRGSAGPLKGLNFLLDTGASPTVLDRRVAERLHLEQLPASIAVVGGSVEAAQATAPTLEVGPARRDNLNVVVEDLSFFQKAFPVRIDAVVGLDMLGRVLSKSTTPRARFVLVRAHLSRILSPCGSRQGCRSSMPSSITSRSTCSWTLAPRR